MKINLINLNPIKKRKIDLMYLMRIFHQNLKRNPILNNLELKENPILKNLQLKENPIVNNPQLKKLQMIEIEL